jgi:hypothetical protein
MPKPSKEAISAMTSTVMSDLAAVKVVVGDTEEMAGLETFVSISLRLIAATNPSKLRDIMRVVEIQARMDGKHVYE